MLSHFSSLFSFFSFGRRKDGAYPSFFIVFLIFSFIFSSITGMIALVQASETYTSFGIPPVVELGGGTTYTILGPEKGVAVNFLGWDDTRIRFRPSTPIDISSFSSLQVKIQLISLSGELPSQPLHIQLYDNNWTKGASQEVLLPVIEPMSGEVAVTIPMTSLLNGVFNPQKVTDINIKLLGTGPIGASLIISDIGGMQTVSDSPVIIKPPTPPVFEINPITAPTFFDKPYGPITTSDAFLVSNSVIGVVLNGNINSDLAKNPDSWRILSTEDPVFSVPILPTIISYTSATLDAEDRDKNGQTTADVVKRYTVYLTLAKPLTTGRTYTISLDNSIGQPYYYDGTNGYTMPGGTFGPWTLRAGIEEGAARAIKINQLGYVPQSQKRYAYVGYWLGSGGSLPVPTEPMSYRIMPSRNGRTIRMGKTVYRGYDPMSGEQVHEIALQDVPAGTYTIDIPTIGRSAEFRIGGASYEALYTTARGLFHQRSGTALEAVNTPWTHPLCHSVVYKTDMLEDWGKFFPATAPKDSPLTMQGGWYDAGDFDIRPLHLNVVEQLLLATEITSATDDGFNIPESGNGLPDLLDEALYGLRIWEILQEPSGAVRGGIESSGHPSTGTCADDTLAYWTYAPNRYASYGFAATAAHSARLLQQYTSISGVNEHAAELKKNAIKAWTWAEAQTALGTTSPVPQTDEQKKKTLNRQRLWAAGELFALTADPEYQQTFKSLWPELKGPTHFDTIHQLWGMANAKGGSVDIALQTDVKNRIVNSGDQFVLYVDQNMYRNSKNPGYPITWGNGTNVTKYIAPAILANHFNPQQKYIDAIATNFDYLMGANATGRSWVTGLGYAPPEFPLHLNSMYDAIPEPVPGLPVNGPHQTAQTGLCEPGNYWQCLVYNGFYPGATKYLDSSPTPIIHQYSPWARMAPMNEFSIWTDMGYIVLTTAILYDVSGETPSDMRSLSPVMYPLHP